MGQILKCQCRLCLLAQTIDSDFFCAGVVDNVRSISSKSFRLCATIHKIHMVINFCGICERVD
jgi:hypothetical protein